MLTEAVQAEAARRTYVTLDGLRGVAALAVAIYHYENIARPFFFPSAYIAVDLFFVISGFVLANAYGRQLSTTMGAGEFMKRRIVRLYPLYLLGTFLTCLGVLGAMMTHLPISWTGVSLTATAIAALFFLPAPWSAPLGGLLYPLNVPAWSLFWELVSNLAYALLAPRLSNRLLAIIIIASGCTLAAHMGLTGRTGLGFTWDGAIGGLMRVAFGFFAGVAIFRLYAAGRLGRFRLPPLLVVTIPLVFFAINAGTHTVLYCAICTFFVMPVIVGLAVQVEPVKAARIYTTLGIASYPLYMIHYPLLRFILGAIQKVAHRNPAVFAPWAGITAVATLFFVALFVEARFDRPLRAWLTRPSRRELPLRSATL